MFQWYFYTKKNGYLNELSKHITLEPQYIPCEDQQPSYFDLEDGRTLLLNNGTTTLVNLPTLPLPASAKLPEKPIMDINFKSPGFVSIKKMSSSHSIQTYLRQVVSPSAVDNIIPTKLAGGGLTESQFEITEIIKDWALDPIKMTLAVVAIIAGWVIIIGIAISALFVYRSPVGAAARYLYQRIRGQPRVDPGAIELPRIQPPQQHFEINAVLNPEREDAPPQYQEQPQAPPLEEAQAVPEQRQWGQNGFYWGGILQYY